MKKINLARETARNNGRSPLTGLMFAMREYFTRSRAERQLHQLDDRLLSDIGLNRGEISRQVWGD